MAKDYNSINFKNKDVDKFATKFGNNDPEKGVVSQAKDTMMNMGKVKYTGQKKSDAQQAAYWNAEMKKAKQNFNSIPIGEGKKLVKVVKRIDSAADSTKKYTERSLNKLKP
tara:strand:- start:796 stop:1128 length:333 start_codon:yes stop_codon:yes gene_type:complete